MSRLLPIAAVLAFVSGAPVLAQDNKAEPVVPALPQQQDRTQQQNAPVQPQGDAAQPGVAHYSFQKVTEGFLRLDTQSGAVALCGPRAVGWACQAVPEERAAFDREITRLQDEVAALKKELAAIKSSAKDNEVKLKLPTREEVEQARAFVEEAWRRLVDMLNAMQKDMMRKG